MTGMQLGKIKKGRETLRNQVLKKLQHAIYTNEINQGKTITEREIVREFGVSRTPVREALCMLNAIGLIKSIPEKGFIVGQWTVNEIKNAMETREVLEEFALDLVIKKINNKEIERLDIILHKMKNALSDEDEAFFIKAYHQFHTQIISASKNKEVLNFIQLLRNKVLPFQNLLISNKDNMNEIYQESKEILEAIIQKNRLRIK